MPKNLQKFLFDTPYKGKISAIQGDINSFDMPNYGESEDGIVIEISPVDSRPAFIGMRLIFKDAMNDYRAVVYKIQDKSIFAIVPKTLMFQGRQPKLGDQLSSKISH